MKIVVPKHTFDEVMHSNSSIVESNVNPYAGSDLGTEEQRDIVLDENAVPPKFEVPKEDKKPKDSEEDDVESDETDDTESDDGSSEEDEGEDDTSDEEDSE